MKYVFGNIAISIISLIVIISVEARNMNSKSYKVIEESYEMDQDVQREYDYIHHLDDLEKHSLIVKNLRKNYGEHEIVKDISFKTDKNECLVLLGTNGAGKSSTFKCMTGETNPNSGKV